MGRSYRVVSPHFDDAVLSCALFMAGNSGTRVTTVFADGPSAVAPLTPWDRATRYFEDGDDVIAERRREDARAASLLGVELEFLPFWDGQYRTARYSYKGPAAGDLPAAVGAELERLARQRPVEAWVIPLGLGHDDHRLVAAACLELAVGLEATCYVYEEIPYYEEVAPEVADQIQNLRDRGLRLAVDDTLAFSGDQSIKRDAIWCYRSQLHALGRRARRAVRVPERIWRLELA
jgi:LmbE family N-acetylglucosaminyl deacetylase